VGKTWTKTELGSSNPEFGFAKGKTNGTGNIISGIYVDDEWNIKWTM
jgi:hypothetical protein